jgi:chemotaxis protein histidine kinase CheA
MLSRIAELSAEELSQLESQIVSEFETVESQELSQQVVDTLDALATAAEAVRGERTRRVQEQEALTQKAAEAAARVHETSDMVGEEDGEPEETPAEEDAEPMEEEEDEKKAPEVIPALGDESPEPASASTEAEPAAELSADDTAEASDTELSASETSETELSAEEPSEAELSSEEPSETSETELSADEPSEAELSTSETSTASEDTAPAELAVEETPTTQPAPQENVEATVTAAAEPGGELVIEPPASHQPVEKAPAAVTITAGADIPGYTAGTTINTMGDVAEAFVKRLHSLRRVNGGDGEQHVVATLGMKYPDDRMLFSSDAEANFAKIQAVTSPEALVASGGYCAPLETRYDVFSLGSTARPVRDALVRFGADRGGIRYIEPPVLADYSGAVGLWTAANDAAESPNPATKPCLEVACGQEITAVADAVTLCLQFGNLATRAYPEMVARHNELALIQHAREAEQNLLTQIKALSTKVTAAKVLGVARDFLVQIDRASAAYRYRHRLDANFPLRAIVPAWVMDAIRSDLAMQMPGDDTLNVADARINSFFSNRNLNVSWSMDGVPGFSAEVDSTTLDEYPATFEWDLYAEGSWLFLDGGTLDLGVIRDSTLVGTNDYKMFVETFEGVALIGVESIHVTSTFAATGEAQALVDTVGS